MHDEATADDCLESKSQLGKRCKWGPDMRPSRFCTNFSKLSGHILCATIHIITSSIISERKHLGVRLRKLESCCTSCSYVVQGTLSNKIFEAAKLYLVSDMSARSGCCKKLTSASRSAALSEAKSLRLVQSLQTDLRSSVLLHFPSC